MSQVNDGNTGNEHPSFETIVAVIEKGTLEDIKHFVKKSGNVLTINGRTALCSAALNLSPVESLTDGKGYALAILQYIVSKGANVNAKTHNGLTPLHLAALDNPRSEVLTCLIDLGADPYLKNDDGKTALDVAHSEKHRKILRKAMGIPEPVVLPSTPIAQPSSDYIAPFEDIFEAAAQGNVQDVQYFLTKGTDVNTQNQEAYTPLHFAAERNSNIEVLKYLISQSADVHAKNSSGRTPLHNAAHSNPNIEVLKYLISQGVVVDAQEAHGWTPLYLAALGNSSVEILKYLISLSTDVNVKDKYGCTPLDIANTEKKKRILRSAGGRRG